MGAVGVFQSNVISSFNLKLIFKDAEIKGAEESVNIKQQQTLTY